MSSTSLSYLSLKRLALADGKSKRCGVSGWSLPVFTSKNFFLSVLYSKRGTSKALITFKIVSVSFKPLLMQSCKSIK